MKRSTYKCCRCSPRSTTNCATQPIAVFCTPTQSSSVSVPCPIFKFNKNMVFGQGQNSTTNKAGGCQRTPLRWLRNPASEARCAAKSYFPTFLMQHPNTPLRLLLPPTDGRCKITHTDFHIALASRLAWSMLTHAHTHTRSRRCARLTGQARPESHVRPAVLATKSCKRTVYGAIHGLKTTASSSSA
ncbi:unnamed protein product, partial [Ectocarpus fasciculatus]